MKKIKKKIINIIKKIKNKINCITSTEREKTIVIDKTNVNFTGIEMDVSEEEEINENNKFSFDKERINNINNNELYNEQVREKNYEVKKLEILKQKKEEKRKDKKEKERKEKEEEKENQNFNIYNNTEVSYNEEKQQKE